MRPHLNPPLKGEEEIGGTLLCPFPSQGKVRRGSWKRTPPQSSPKRGGRNRRNSPLSLPLSGEG